VIKKHKGALIKVFQYEPFLDIALPATYHFLVIALFVTED